MAKEQLDYELDIFGQQPSGLYTRIWLCFATRDASSPAAMNETLEDGLERVSHSFPWVAGQIINEGAVQYDSGVFKVHSPRSMPNFLRKTSEETRQRQLC